MPLFRRATVEPPKSAERDIPPLYTDFYRIALRAAGKPDSERNVLALAEFTAANLALNAHTWFQALGDPASQQRFTTRFDASKYRADQVVRVPDEMIDFLWAWSHRAHPGLRQFVDSMRDTIASKLTAYGDHLPLNLWQDER
jgi:hypothetical protein